MDDGAEKTPGLRGKRPLFEVCCDTLDSVRAAAEAGVERVELCSGLLLGGLTPSLAAIEWARANTSLQVFALIRARAGDFLLDDDEAAQLHREILLCRQAGAQGIVVGALNRDGAVDRPRLQAFLDAAGPLPLTFHRAFDLCADPQASLQVLLELGVARLLSSGAAPSADRGCSLLRSLIEQAGDRLVVMPGGGVRPGNVRQLVQATGAHEVHFSASTSYDGPMRFRNEAVAMGGAGLPGEYERRGATPDSVRAFFQAFDQDPDPGIR